MICRLIDGLVGSSFLNISREKIYGVYTQKSNLFDEIIRLIDILTGLGYYEKQYLLFLLACLILYQSICKHNWSDDC